MGVCIPYALQAIKISDLSIPATCRNPLQHIPLGNRGCFQPRALCTSQARVGLLHGTAEKVTPALQPAVALSKQPGVDAALHQWARAMVLCRGHNKEQHSIVEEEGMASSYTRGGSGCILEKISSPKERWGTGTAESASVGGFQNRGDAALTDVGSGQVGG